MAGHSAKNLETIYNDNFTDFTGTCVLHLSYPYRTALLPIIELADFLFELVVVGLSGWCRNCKRSVVDLLLIEVRTVYSIGSN